MTLPDWLFWGFRLTNLSFTLPLEVSLSVWISKVYWWKANSGGRIGPNTRFSSTNISNWAFPSPPRLLAAQNDTLNDSSFWGNDCDIHAPFPISAAQNFPSGTFRPCNRSSSCRTCFTNKPVFQRSMLVEIFASQNFKSRGLPKANSVAVVRIAPIRIDGWPMSVFIVNRKYFVNNPPWSK